MEKRSVLLTGANGFLGKIASNELKVMGYDVACLNRSAGPRIDITTPFNIDTPVSFDTVIHTAGKAHTVPRSEPEAQAFYDVNFEGTKNLCRALEKLPKLPSSFIFISTVAVYGVDEGFMISEEHPLNGKTPYADSKILAEEWLRHWTDEHRITLGILRLPLIAGPNAPGNLGAMVAGIKSGRYLSIGHASAQKSMVWAADIVRIIPRLAAKGGIYNLTDGYHPTFRELEKSIASATGNKKPISIPYWGAKGLAIVGDVIGSRFPINSDKLQKITSDLTFDDSQATQILGWNPTPVLSKVQEIA